MPDDLISKRALLKKTRRMYAPDEIDSIAPVATACVTVDDIHRAAVVDAVPVVRCKECKFRGFDSCPMCHDEYTYDEDDGGDYFTVDNTTDDGFCHKGAKMDGGAQG